MRGIGELVAAAVTAARRLGSEAVTDVEVLVGALDLDDGVLRGAIARSGVTAEQVDEQARALVGGRDGGSAEGGVGFSPLAQQVLHRAYGFALAQGRDRATAVDAFVAMLWHDPVSSAMTVLERCGVTAEALAAALADEGVALPDLPLPRWAEVSYGPKVSFPVELSDRVIRSLTEDLGIRRGWDFNIDGDTAWLHGEADLDLLRHVSAIVGADVVVVDDTWARTVKVDVEELDSAPDTARAFDV